MQAQPLDTIYLLSVFVAMGLVSFAERALPFVAAKWLKKQRWVSSLGAFLTVHAATGASIARDAWPVAEIAAIALTILLQWFVKSPLVSIFSGTALYVAAVNGYIPFLA